jgi:hypothetical protein
MSNRVRYYITESNDRPVVRSVPVTISTQPVNDLMMIEKHPDPSVKRDAVTRTPIGRVVKVLRKPHNLTQS